jgi:CheY-like chemotaxis protein
MQKRHKILLLDDDQDILDLYREMLAALPTEPEVHTATSGARALTLLETEPFTLLISDLKMPKMDGLQLLTIVRKRFPSLRTIVMSALSDDQFKDRAYGLGIDQFLEKPRTGKEINYFCECVEGLLTKDESGGFRGVQSKSLVDIIQLECLSQSSSVLKIASGPVEGFIWIQNGEVIDAQAADLAGEEAFRCISSWKGGNFETLPPEPEHPRKIFTSYQGLLLESAQAIDEAQGIEDAAAAAAKAGPAVRAPDKEKEPETPDSKLFELSRMPGVEFLVAVKRDKSAPPIAWGLESPELVGNWVHGGVKQLTGLGEKLGWGQLRSIEARGVHGNVAIAIHDGSAICAGFQRALSQTQVRDAMKRIIARWNS